MTEFSGHTRKNTQFPKGEDAVESRDLLRATYLTGEEDLEAPVDPHTFSGGLNGFETAQEMRDETRRTKPRPPE